MNIREKLFLLVLLLALGYLTFMLINGLSLYKSYDADNKNIANMIKEECEATGYFVVTIGNNYGGRVYDCNDSLPHEELEEVE